MTKSLQEITDLLRQVIEGKVKKASVGDDADDRTREHKPGDFADELLQENKETIPSGTASYDEEEPVDTDEDKEEETTEGAENLLAGPSGYEGVPEPEDKPKDVSTSSGLSVEKQSAVKKASTNELAEAAVHYAARIAGFLKEAAEDSGYLLSEISPTVLSRLVASKVVEEARARANLVGAILHSVKLAQDAAEEEEEGKEKKKKMPTDEYEETEESENEPPKVKVKEPEETPEETAEEPSNVPVIPAEDIDRLVDALSDLVRAEEAAGRSGAPRGLEPGTEEEPSEEDEEEKGQILERLLSEAPAPAAEEEKKKEEEIKRASDEEILSATLDALLARGESLTDLASKGGRIGYQLAKCAEAHLRSRRYVPLSRLPAEKRARARRLRDHVEDFISDLYNKSRN